MLFAQYLDELKKIRLLEPAEEAALWRGFKVDGCLDCRRRLIEHYQPLVFKEAMRWRAHEGVVMDLIQEGTVGLIEAVENFDPERGVAFSLYAPHRIRGRMLTYLEREGKRKWASIDGPADEDESGTLADRLVDEAAAVPEQAERNFLIEPGAAGAGTVPAKEQLVLSGVYLEEREPKQLAEALDMSLSHLYRLQKQGIRRVRGMLARLMHELKAK
ncbi:sigma-70 region 2 domain protein [Thermosinus carboxydivorans Nor1]|uniref:Sigma-70 region 2 domain protein n=1 Tax=Thermosinus carboxydivorans Nor1 TaxID=401526 RepID=A1HRG0_9FIRM|nr:sigma-70 family RNA polymerase sigma factor [Thermosinus carboxydivorans]EAX47475.1 sigma-70 region 2 domain protein [Thermosinus carboxydivorans Nor1]